MSLSWMQVRLLLVSDAQRDYANQVAQALQQQGMRVEVDASGDRLGKQIHATELERIPVVAVSGQREVGSQTSSIRTRQSGDLGALIVSEVVEELQEAIDQKAIC